MGLDTGVLVNQPLAPDPILSQYRMKLQPDAEMHQIAEDYEIVARDGDVFEVIVPATEATRFLELAPDAELMLADIRSELDILDSIWGSEYHTFATVETHLLKLAQMYPDIVAVKIYGRSQEGRPLYVLKISDNVRMNESEPEVMLTAATHGNELITVEVLLGMIDYIVQNYKTVPRVRDIVANRELFFIPVVNPDGYIRQSRYSNGVDPNREYPWPQKPDRQPNECIAAVMKFFHERQIKASIDFHSYGELVMYPWAFTRDAPDNTHLKRFDEISKQMTATNQYRYGQISRILYPAAGSSADYYYWKAGSLSFGIEIGSQHVPNPSYIPYHVKEHLESTFRLIEYAE